MKLQQFLYIYYCFLYITTNSTGLMHAITMNRIGEIKQYIHEGAEVNVTDNEGNTPLMLAAWQGSDTIIEILLNHGALIDMQNIHKQTALMIATMGTRRCAMKKLLQRGANPNLQDIHGNTAFMLATFTEKPKVSVDLARIFFAIPNNLNLRLKNCNNNTWLSLAIKAERFYLAKEIINYISSLEDCALKTKLLNQRNCKGETPLTLSLQVFDNCITNLLLNAGACIEKKNGYGNSPLMVASLKRNTVIVRRLIAMDACLDHQNNFGYTALMFAVVNGFDKVAEDLLNAGANQYCKNNKGATARELALFHQYHEIADLIACY